MNLTFTQRNACVRIIAKVLHTVLLSVQSSVYMSMETKLRMLQTDACGVLDEEIGPGAGRETLRFIGDDEIVDIHTPPTTRELQIEAAGHTLHLGLQLVAYWREGSPVHRDKHIKEEVKAIADQLICEGAGDEVELLFGNGFRYHREAKEIAAAAEVARF